MYHNTFPNQINTIVCVSLYLKIDFKYNLCFGRILIILPIARFATNK